MQEVDRVDAVVRDETGAVTGGDQADCWRLVSGAAADEATLADLQFAWRAVRAVKSNAILLAKDGAAVGIGMGQVNRVDSCYLAVRRAGEERARGAVAASDAFFPFADGLQILLDAGVRAVVAPGGSDPGRRGHRGGRGGRRDDVLHRDPALRPLTTPRDATHRAVANSLRKQPEGRTCSVCCRSRVRSAGGAHW